MRKLEARDLLEEMQWKYAGGPLPKRRRDAAARVVLWGCAARLLVMFLFCVAVLLVARWLF